METKHRKPKLKIGDTFAGGQVTIIEAQMEGHGPGRGWRYLVQCRCGRTRLAKAYQLTSGRVQGCRVCDPPRSKSKITAAVGKTKLKPEIRAMVDAAYKRHVDACRKNGIPPESYDRIAGEIQEWPDLGEDTTPDWTEVRAGAVNWHYRQYDAPVQSER